MEPDGQLYACDHLINAEHRLGRLDEQTLAAAVDASVQLPFGQQKSLRRECQTCSVKMVCQGGCPAHLNAAGNNRLCGGYYRFFSDILAPVRPFSRDLNGLKASAGRVCWDCAYCVAPYPDDIPPLNRRVSREQKAMAAAVSMILAGGAHAAQQERPNVIVIIADDMGYSDISPFGGEIPTPNLQAMAEQGMRMSQYYTSPMSAPARSMLLTGNSNQQAGMGGMWWYDSTIGKEGYELRLTDRVTTMAERFKDAGYNTLMAGKWHLGFVPGATPKDRGFNHAFAFMGGGTSHFNDAIPLGTVEAFHTYYTRDGERVSLPDDFYSSEAYARQMNSWIKATPKEQPVFAPAGLHRPS